mmetsp:Transcript_2915/g.3722  ORF Transcript_2915/g.3722 Transcript_2915/m.3722 type:complete len:83 (-) Transcript_2915:163-411(-)
MIKAINPTPFTRPAIRSGLGAAIVQATTLDISHIFKPVVHAESATLQSCVVESCCLNTGTGLTYPILGIHHAWELVITTKNS